MPGNGRLTRIGLPKRYPCIWSQPSRGNTSAWFPASMPSAATFNRSEWPSR